ncbi:CidA/LrgA family protein [Secundilactobacillus kimchicus]|uniref:Effector of murein hydrolase LrgA n=1 Tax=Secundilactobacillus kimchicus JCM 15530 TaxID=1302272 RepID=A0A0R1HW01_9LACO|nr:CidA/LrgA family protein [Secundilactobacillus kimchicus]KRK48052.1 effector of murein hydrolase LrgA [Secundilactobacillus kimchicus JCM 15530]MBT9670983.1 murein hydrolase regulator LrgA [Secundilactobacillus kimchicus]
MASNATQAKNQAPEHEPAPILQQMAIFASVLFVSSLISPLFPKSFPVPTPVIGLVLMYLLLATHIIKLYQIEKMADFLISLIAFLFVPSGVQMAASLNVFTEHGPMDGVMMIVTIILATIILLVVIAYTTACFMWVSRKLFHKSTDVE